MSADFLGRQQQPSFGHHESAPPPGGGAGQPPGPQRPTYSKRGKITIVACVPCRRRKTKCDGRRPNCSQCQSRDGQCHYDMSEDQRRLTYLRENADALAEEKSNLEAVLWNLRNSTEDESFEILRRIRGGADVQSLVQQIQASRSLTQVGGSGSSARQYSFSPIARSYFETVLDDAEGGSSSSTGQLERLVQTFTVSSPNETDEIVKRLRRRQPVNQILEAAESGNLLATDLPEVTGMDIDDPGLGPPAHARPMAGNALAPMTVVGGRAPLAHTPPNVNGYRWTTVTDDRDFIDHLLNTYFMWQHSFFQNFPEELFRQDFEGGRTKYCSRVLVNAICAAGCLLSDRPEARGDPHDPNTAGAGFFDEGMKLLNQSDRSSIPTTAGVFLLSHVEGYRGRLGAMWGLVGRSARMAMDLNLHLRYDRVPSSQLSEEAQTEESARIHAFWGCFVSDQVTSMTLGRLPQILTNAITVELPPLDAEKDSQPWGPEGNPARKRPGARAIAFRECAQLAKIVNSTLLMFFAPAQIISGKSLLDEYNKYQKWFRRLPDLCQPSDNAPAHVLCLHLYYHASVLLLFRPFIRARFTESDISPADICRQCAVSISDLFARHFTLYGTTGIYTFQIQCLLAACTMHIINLPAISSANALTNACNSFHELIPLNTWAVGSLNVIKGLVQKWNIILPGDVEEALHKEYKELPQAILSHFEDGAAPQAELFKSPPAKRAAFLNPGSQLHQKRQRLAPVQTSTTSSRSSRSRTGAPPEGESTGGTVTGTSGPSEPGTPRSGGAEATFADRGPSDNNQGFPRAGGMSSDLEGIPSGPAGSPRRGTSAGREQQPNYLFAPFANQPVPLLGPTHTSNDAETAWGEEVGKVVRDFDGLKFEGDGWFDPFMGFQGD